MTLIRLVGALAVPLALAVTLSAQSADVQLQRAVQREIATGDTKAAIAEYKRIADRAGSNRAVAAQALLRLAEAHQKLGDAEANKVYEQVVSRYADQPEAVATARTRLNVAKPVITGGLIRRRVWSGPDAERMVSGRVSPDGRYLVFSYGSRQVGTIGGELVWVPGSDVMIRELATGQERLLAHNPTGQTGEMMVSRDGRRVAFVATTVPGFSDEIRLVGVDSSGLRTVMTKRPDDPEIELLDWSSDGTRILAITYVRPRGPMKLVWVNVADGTVRVLADVTSNSFNAAVSPDGRYIAFGGILGAAGREVRLIASDGTGETVLSTNPDDGFVAGWSPDGKNVIMTSARTTTTGLWALPVLNGVANGAPTMLERDLCGCHRVTHLGMTTSGTFYFREQNRDLKLSPDGKQVAFATDAANAPEVWAVENFLPAMSK